MENQENKENKSPIEDFKNQIIQMPNEKRWAITCYIPIFNVLFCVLALVRMINSKFSVFHARQGLVLFGLWFFTILIALINQTFSLMLWGVVLLLHGSGIFIAAKGSQAKIPVLGDLAMKIPEDYFFKLLTGKVPEENTGSTESSDSQNTKL